MKELDPSKITITGFPGGVESVHGTATHAGVIWCGTRQIPAQVICFDAATLDVIDAITMPTDGIEDGSAFYPGMEQLIVHKATGLMYGNCHGDLLCSVRVVEMWLDGGRIQYRDVISYEWDFFWEEHPSLAVIEIDQQRGVLYAGMWDDTNGASIRRYSLSSRDENGHLVLIDEHWIESDIPILYGIHSLVCEGDYLYVTSQMQPAWVAKINISNETMSTDDFFYFPTGFNTITDDSCYCDGYLFCGFEFDPHKGTVVRIDANDLSSYSVLEFPYGASCYGVFNIDGMIYALHFSSVPLITVIDPYTLEFETFTASGIPFSPNELVCSGGRFYMPTWTTPAMGNTVLLSCPKINVVNSVISDASLSFSGGMLRVAWEGSAPEYRITVKKGDGSHPTEVYYVASSPFLMPVEYHQTYNISITPLDGAVIGETTELAPYVVPPLIESLSLVDGGTYAIAELHTSDTFEKAIITISSAGEEYTILVKGSPLLLNEYLFPNIFPGEKATITVQVGDSSVSCLYHGISVPVEMCEASGVYRITEDKQSIVYARGSGAYAILTTISGATQRYGVLAFVINEDNEIVLNDSMTSDYLYSDLSVSGEKPFLLNDETPFGVNLKYAWRGSNTDALEICVKLCLQGE